MSVAVRSAAVVSAALGLVMACSAGGDSKPQGGGSGGGGAGGTAGSGASGGGGSGGTGAGGSGGISVDTGVGASGGSGGLTGDACAETNAVADDPTPLPADIIWAVDQSGSMDQEASYVQDQINTFASMIAGTTIDYHVVMIASTSQGQQICVPPPLSGGGCGDGPRFRLVDQYIDSNDPLDRIIDQYPKYQDFLRPNAVKHFVVVTDDNATDPPINSSAAFTNAVNGLQPAGMFAKWQFHSIFAYGPIFIVGCIGVFGSGAAYGLVYEELVAQTGGAKGVICDGAPAWNAVFQAITTAVIVGSKVSCEYAIPDPGSGQTLDPSKVNVDYLPGGQPPAQPIYRVDDLAGCSAGANQGGWYFDNNAAPTKILLCPQTCTAVQSDPAAKISVKFGCESVYKPPA